MKTSRDTPRMKVAIASAVAMLALTAATALAQVPSTTAYFFSSHPMISGTVVSVNDREMVVSTDQGEQVVLVVDSRTMAPRDLAPGMVMRAEFLALDDCRFYAQRVMPVRGGMSAVRLQAYANTRDSREAIERSVSSASGERWERGERESDAESPGNQPQTLTAYSPSRMMTATPNTADYRLSVRPMISGRVIAVNDHRLVVVTDQGQQIGMAMDSRTMLPREVEPGTIVRADFTQMGDGRYLANRISRTETGATDREQAYAHTRDNQFVIAQNGSDCWSAGHSDRIRETSAVEHRETVATPEPVVAAPAPVVAAPAPVVAPPALLPQTASHEPLLLLLGLLALGAAGIVTIVRSLQGV